MRLHGVATASPTPSLLSRIHQGEESTNEATVGNLVLFLQFIPDASSPLALPKFAPRGGVVQSSKAELVGLRATIGDPLSE